MMNDKPIFVDTNILLAATDESRRDHRRAIALLSDPEKKFSISGQVLREYIVVATRPETANGFGMKPADASNNIDQFRGRFVFLEETAAVFRMLQKLILRHDLKGERIHDANIAATMITHGLTALVTLNPNDFQLFDSLTVTTL